MKIRRFVTVLLALVSAGAWAEDLTLDDVMDKVKANPFPESYKADTKIELLAAGTPMTMTGHMAYDLPRMKMKSTMTMSGQTINSVVALDADGVQWIENRMGPGMTQIMRMDTKVLEESLGNLPGMAQMVGGGASMHPGPEMWDLMVESMDLSYKGIESVNGDDAYVLSGTYREEYLDQLNRSGQLKDIGMDDMVMTMFVRVADSFPVKMQMKNADDAFATTVLLTNVEVNPVFADGDLDYTPPDGAPVIDMTETMRQQLQPQQNAPQN